MATYKVIQDIEAEDHILGPLTLKQFIYSLVCVFFLYISFVSLTKHLDWLLIFFIPPAGIAGFLAFPFVRDQPTEIWVLAKIRFLFMPRKRIWDQNGIKDQLVITAPKKIEQHYTNGLSQTEVKSRLHTLADIIDSRGWAMKNVDPNTMSAINLIKPVRDSDRLISPIDMPKPVPDYDITPTDDIMDDLNNPVAQQFSQMITASTKLHKEQLIQSLNDIRTHMHQDERPAINPATSADDHHKPIEMTQQTPQNHPQTSTPKNPPDGAILNLSRNNDRNIASLAREANKLKNSGDEVVVSLR